MLNHFWIQVAAPLLKPLPGQPRSDHFAPEAATSVHAPAIILCGCSMCMIAAACSSTVHRAMLYSRRPYCSIHGNSHCPLLTEGPSFFRGAGTKAAAWALGSGPGQKSPKASPISKQRKPGAYHGKPAGFRPQRPTQSAMLYQSPSFKGEPGTTWLGGRS
jgi:hypothetical protein